MFVHEFRTGARFPPRSSWYYLISPVLYNLYRMHNYNDACIHDALLGIAEKFPKLIDKEFNNFDVLCACCLRSSTHNAVYCASAALSLPF